MATMYQRTPDGVQAVYPETTASRVTTDGGQTVEAALALLLAKGHVYNGLDQTGAGYALDARAASALLARMPSRSLLDNGSFAVNQRGAASYAGAAGYSLDRWYRGSGVQAEPKSDGVLLTGAATGDRSFDQRLEEYAALAGKTVTLSAEVQALTGGATLAVLADGVSVGSAPITAAGITPLTVTLPAMIADSLSVRVCPTAAGGTLALRRVKLELGAAGTLANDPPADRAAELLRCMRFYQQQRMVGVTLGAGYASGSAVAYVTLDTLAPMRIAPTVTCDAPTALYLAGGDKTAAVTSLGGAALYDGRLRLAVNTSGLTSGRLYALRGGDTVIAFSAEL